MEETLVQGLEAFLAADIGKLVIFVIACVLIGSFMLIWTMMRWVSRTIIPNAQKQATAQATGMSAELAEAFMRFVGHVEASVTAISEAVLTQTAVAQAIRQGLDVVQLDIGNQTKEHIALREQSDQMAAQIDDLMARLQALPAAVAEILLAEDGQIEEKFAAMSARFDQLEERLIAEIRAAIAEARETNGIIETEDKDVT